MIIKLFVKVIVIFRSVFLSSSQSWPKVLKISTFKSLASGAFLIPCILRLLACIFLLNNLRKKYMSNSVLPCIFHLWTKPSKFSTGLSKIPSLVTISRNRLHIGDTGALPNYPTVIRDASLESSGNRDSNGISCVPIVLHI